MIARRCNADPPGVSTKRRNKHAQVRGGIMQSKVTEIAPDIYRISTFHPDYGIQFNQFLLKDDEPFIMHTGFKKMFSMTLEGVASVIDPSTLRWVGFSHFESDECGALNEWLRVAPHSQAVCSFVGTMVMVNDFADRPARPLNDNEVLDTGVHRLRFLATPHVPHAWDAGIFFEENDRTLLCSDLFFHPGDPEPLTELDIVGAARESIYHGSRESVGPRHAVYAVHRQYVAPLGGPGAKHACAHAWQFFSR